MAQRRPKGTGSIRNRGTDRRPRWFARYFVEVDGQRRQVQEGPFRVKPDAEAWLADQLKLQREGRPTVPGRATVAELLDEWLPTVRHRLSPNTFAEYERAVRLRLRPALGARRLSELRGRHIDAMLDELRRPGANKHNGRKGRALSEASLVKVYRVLHTALAWGVRQQLLPRNPADDVDRPRPDDVEMAAWDAEQLGVFLRHSRSDRLAPLFWTAAYTGMRLSELLGLNWDDVDLSDGTIAVRRIRIRVNGKMVERKRTKTRRARVVDIDPSTVAVLRSWATAQKRERLAAGSAWQESPALFTTVDGLPLTSPQVQKPYKRLVTSAGVPVIRFHDLRHTHASLLLAAGEPPIDVAGRLGHTLATLSRVYAHVIPSRGQRAALAFAALVEGD